MTSLCSPGSRRQLLRHTVMFSGVIFHRKARASVICYTWSSLNVGELRQPSLQSLPVTLSNFSRGSIATCSHFRPFGWKENIPLISIRAQNSFWKPHFPCAGKEGFIAEDSTPAVAKGGFLRSCWDAFRLLVCSLNPSIALKPIFPSECYLSFIPMPFPLRTTFYNHCTLSVKEGLNMCYRQEFSQIWTSLLIFQKRFWLVGNVQCFQKKEGIVDL